jgi:hypothetical protein
MEILGTNRGPALRCDSEHSMHPALFSRDLDAGFRCPGQVGAWVKALLFAWLLMLARPATSTAAPPGSAQGAPAAQISLPEGMGWENWTVARDQHSPRVRVEVFVPKDVAPDAAKVRVVLVQTPRPNFPSPQTVLDNEVAHLKPQCKQVSTRTIRQAGANLIYDLRGIGCPGQKGEHYLLTRIAFIGEWQLEATYAPMTPTDDLSPPEKERAVKLLSSVTIIPGSSPPAKE